MSKRSKLDPEERALWDKVVATVTPLHRAMPRDEVPSKPARVGPRRDTKKAANTPKQAMSSQRKLESPSVKRQTDGDSGFRRNDGWDDKRARQDAPANTLDSHWDRRFKKGVIEPDVSIDLHGIGLAGAYARLDGALEQAEHQGLRVILLVTGKARSHDRASGQGRGAIASVVRDWLAASRHASHISAVRNAHPRHGGAGALYIILKR